MQSIFLLSRTIANLSLKQIVARPSFKLRRLLAPFIANLFCNRLTNKSKTIRHAQTNKHLPSFLTQTSKLKNKSLFLAGKNGSFPELPPYKPETTDPLYHYDFYCLKWFPEAIENPCYSKKQEIDLNSLVLSIYYF